MVTQCLRGGCWAGWRRIDLTENEIATQILDASYKIHTALGPGLLEKIYEAALAYELRKRGFRVETQRAIPVVYDGQRLGEGFRADLIVEDRIIVEIKSLEIVPTVAYKILLTYLRLADIRLGILINFREEHLKDGIKRVVDQLDE